MVWSFLWRFALGFAILAPASTKIAGFLVGANQGTYEGALSAGYVAIGAAALIVGAFAYFEARRARRA